MSNHIPWNLSRYHTAESKQGRQVAHASLWVSQDLRRPLDSLRSAGVISDIALSKSQWLRRGLRQSDELGSVQVHLSLSPLKLLPGNRRCFTAGIKARNLEASGWLCKSRGCGLRIQHRFSRFRRGQRMESWSLLA